FNSKGELEYEPNVACLKGSPYGKVLALAMQGSIDFYWHKGSSHEHAEVLNAEHHHDSGDHGDHDHGGQSHSHAENIVTNDGVSGCSGCAGCDAKKKTAQAAHVDSENKKDISERVSENNDPLRERAKKLIKKMSATAHRRTDEKPLTAAHKKYILGVTEDKLRLAYDLDPSNYTNYGNLHLFISTTTYGRDPANDAAAVKLARKTLDFCKKDQIDPASWVTAASAAYNIIYHIGRYHEHFTIAEAKSSLSEFDSCIARYNELLELAVSEGRIVSELRYQEMSERVRYMSKLRESQGVYMKRVMSTKMAVNHQSSSNK
ncbi:MAG: hypothetical protein AB8F34_06585, partial [Akkermansiaceae bacterium]